jgi:amino acid transporter
MVCLFARRECGHRSSPEYSINAAAQGNDENISNKDDPQVRQLYDRDSPQYPYRSHGQYLRAWYALIGCTLFVLFNGWRTFVPPMSVNDFVACYVSVSLSRLLGHYSPSPNRRQILVLLVICVLYQIKFWGINPLKWRRNVSRELQNPRPYTAMSVPRRGQIALVDTDDLFNLENARRFGKWLWVWLK